MLGKNMIDKDTPEWYDKCDTLNEIAEELGLLITFDWYTTEMDGRVIASYWSEKIRHNITIDSDAYEGYKSLAELSDEIAYLDYQAEELEKRLTPIS